MTTPSQQPKACERAWELARWRLSRSPLAISRVIGTLNWVIRILVLRL